MNNIEVIKVYTISVDEMSREDFENLAIQAVVQDERVNTYSLDEYQDLLNDEEYPVNHWVRFIQPENLEIDMSEEDINDLASGNDFEWCFGGIELHIFPSEYEDDDEEGKE